MIFRSFAGFLACSTLKKSSKFEKMNKSLVQLAINAFFHGTSKTQNPGFGYPIRHLLLYYFIHELHTYQQVFEIFYHIVYNNDLKCALRLLKHMKLLLQFWAIWFVNWELVAIFFLKNSFSKKPDNVWSFIKAKIFTTAHVTKVVCVIWRIDLISHNLAIKMLKYYYHYII